MRVCVSLPVYACVCVRVSKNSPCCYLDKVEQKVQMMSKVGDIFQDVERVCVHLLTTLSSIIQLEAVRITGVEKDDDFLLGLNFCYCLNQSKKIYKTF